MFTLRNMAGVALATLMATEAAQAAPMELVVNGGFEDGDTGFTSDLTAASGLPGLMQYAVKTGDFVNFLGTSSPNSGQNYMFVNGFATPNSDETIWAQLVDVTSGVQYGFSLAIANWSNTTPTGVLSARAGGVEFAQFIAPEAPTPRNTYELRTGQFTATSTGSIALALVELSNGVSGNDYLLDDISLTAQMDVVPLPAAGWLLLGGLGALGVLKRKHG